MHLNFDKTLVCKIYADIHNGKVLLTAHSKTKTAYKIIDLNKKESCYVY